MPDDIPDAFGDVLPHPRTLTACRDVRVDRPRLGPPDEEHEQRGSQVAERVHEDRDRRTQPLDEEAGDGRAHEPRARPADLELRIALDEILAADERRQVALVGDVEEDREAPGDEPDDVELPDRERAEHVRDRDGSEGHRASEVARDEDGPAAETVHPDPGRQPEEDEREELERAEEGDLERGRVEQDDRRERQGQLRDLRADLADGLGGPQLEEIGVAPEAPAHLGQGHLRAAAIAAAPAATIHGASLAGPWWWLRGWPNGWGGRIVGRVVVRPPACHHRRVPDLHVASTRRPASPHRPGSGGRDAAWTPPA